MIAASLPLNQHQQNAALPTLKRQRKPSQFADSIQHFKQQYEKTNRKGKTPHSNSEETVIEETVLSNNGGGKLKCLLGSGRLLNISIIVKKKGIRKLKKQVSFHKFSEKIVSESPAKKPQQGSSTLDLLSKFLVAAEQLNKLEQEQKEKVVSEQEFSLQKNQIDSPRKEGRSRSCRDQSQKVMRCYERSCALNDKFQIILDDFIYL